MYGASGDTTSSTERDVLFLLVARKTLPRGGPTEGPSCGIIDASARGTSGSKSICGAFSGCAFMRALCDARICGASSGCVFTLALCDGRTCGLTRLETIACVCFSASFALSSSRHGLLVYY